MMPPFGPTEICDVFQRCRCVYGWDIYVWGVCVYIQYTYLFVYFYINQKIGGTRYADFHWKLKTLIKSFGGANSWIKKTIADGYVSGQNFRFGLNLEFPPPKILFGGPALCWGGRPSLGASIAPPGVAQLIDGHRVLRYLFGLPPTL